MVPGAWGSQISGHSMLEGGKVVIPTRRPPLPQEISLVLFLLGVGDPKAIVRSEGLCQWKLPVTPLEIEPATFRLVAQLPEPAAPPSAAIVRNKRVKNRDIFWKAWEDNEMETGCESLQLVFCLCGFNFIVCNVTLLHYKCTDNVVECWQWNYFHEQVIKYFPWNLVPDVKNVSL
jgi:hypothetical protein